MKKILFLTITLCLIVSLFSISFAVKVPSDVTETKQKTAVEELMKLEVVNGYPDGTYRPDAVVSRSELAKLLVVSYGLDDVAKTYMGKTQYKDVNEVGNHWASGYINISTDYKFINGYPDGTFKPDNTVTYAEAITMCLRALGYTKEIESNGTWPINYISKAQDLKLVKDIEINSYEDGAKRGDIAILIWNTLNTKMEGISGNKTMLEVKFPENVDNEEEDNANTEVEVELKKENVSIPVSAVDEELPYKINYTVTPSDAEVKLEIKEITLDDGSIVEPPFDDYIDEDGYLVCEQSTKQPRTIKVAIILDSDEYEQKKGTELAVFTLKIAGEDSDKEDNNKEDDNKEENNANTEVKVNLEKDSVTIPLSEADQKFPYKINYTVIPSDAKVKLEIKERTLDGDYTIKTILNDYIDENGCLVCDLPSKQPRTIKVAIKLDSDGYKQSKGTELAVFTLKIDGKIVDNSNTEVKVDLEKKSVTVPLSKADEEFPYKINYTVTPSDAKVKLEIKERTLDGEFTIKTILNDYIDENGCLVCDLPSKQPRTIKVAIVLDSDGYKQSKGTQLAVFTFKISTFSDSSKVVKLPDRTTTLKSLGISELGDYKVSKFHYKDIKISSDGSKVTGSLIVGEKKYLILKFDQIPEEIKLGDNIIYPTNKAVAIEVTNRSLGVVSLDNETDYHNIYVYYSDGTQKVIDISDIGLKTSDGLSVGIK